MKTSELIGPALDWAVAKAEGKIADNSVWFCGQQAFTRSYDREETHPYQPQTDWAQGGPIIEREKIETWFEDAWCAKVSGVDPENYGPEWPSGPTVLIAAMRCFVASKLGDEIEIPEELK